MMKLTKQQAIEGHRKMWNWIADEIEKRKKVLDITKAKRIYCANKKLYLKYNSFCCDYSDAFCNNCPLEYGENNSCYNLKRNGLRDMVYKAATWQEQAELARKIANLPKRKDDDKKIKEAIKYLKYQINKIAHQSMYDKYGLPMYEETRSELMEYCETAIEALEKQLAKKVVDKSLVKDNDIVVGAVGRCPCCNEIIDDTTNICDCGQKINWSE